MDEPPPREATPSDERSPHAVHVRSSKLGWPGFAIVVMGVSGSGKSTVGELLSKRLPCPFLDADDFHTAENKEKMRNGIPLTEDDRQPWLADLRNELAKYTRKGEWVVLACSALRPQYRAILLTANQPNEVQCTQQHVTHDCEDGNVKSKINGSVLNTSKVVFAFLQGSVELFASRLEARHKAGKHFMPPSLLKSQFDLLETTEGDHDIVRLDASLSAGEIVSSLINILFLRV